MAKPHQQQRPRQVVKTETVTIEEPKGFLVTRTDLDGFTGNEKFVQFRHGKGVLDLACIFRERPDWVENVGGELIQRKGNPLSEYVEWWERRNAVIEEITAEQAKQFRAWLEIESRKDTDREVAAMRAKQQAKSKNLEGTPQEVQMIKEARASFPAVAMPAWANSSQVAAVETPAARGAVGEAAPSASAEMIPPHESGEMANQIATFDDESPATGGGGTGG